MTNSQTYVVVDDKNRVVYPGLTKTEANNMVKEMLSNGWEAVDICAGMQAWFEEYYPNFKQYKTVRAVNSKSEVNP